jgi:ASC-1-like (ASCH) protein
MTHTLKTWPEYFQAIKAGKKKFELRKNDRNFQTGDRLVLNEYEPETNKYSGDKLVVTAGYILEGGQFGLEDGYCIISLDE